LPDASYVYVVVCAPVLADESRSARFQPKLELPALVWRPSSS